MPGRSLGAKTGNEAQTERNLETPHVVSCGFETGSRSAIIPILIGDETKALEAAAALREQGIFVPAIRYPTVARGAARLRVTLTATHTAEDIRRLGEALARLQLVNREP